MFKRILVPVDGSEPAWNALRTALEIGRKFESEIVIVHVSQQYSNAAFLAMPVDRTALERGNDEIAKLGNQILEFAKENIVKDYPFPVCYNVEVGHPSEKIIAVSKDYDVNLIVIGSRGLSGIAEFFMGSVSSKVSQYAQVPVLIAK